MLWKKVEASEAREPWRLWAAIPEMSDLESVVEARWTVVDGLGLL